MSDLYVEDDFLEDDDEPLEVADLAEEIAELREAHQADREVDAVNQAIIDIQQAYGIRLDPQQVQELGTLIDAGWDGEQAFSALGLDRDDDFETTFNETLERVEREQGRSLLESEVDKLWQEADYRDDPRHIEPGVLHDKATKAGRVEWANDRMREMHADEVKDGTEQFEDQLKGEEFDAGNPRHRIALLNARMAQEGAPQDDTPEPESGETDDGS